MREDRQKKNGERFLYEEIASKISDMIGQGTYLPNDRIPSIRGLSRQLRVSVNTVMEAYAQLENIGMIEARPQSGYYVRVPHHEPQSRRAPRPEKEYTAPNDVVLGDTTQKIMRTLMDPKLVPLGRGPANTGLLPAEKLSRMLSSQSKRFPVQSASYASPQGMKRLRVQIARRMLDTGCSLSADDIVITSGCVEAITLALMATCRPGDTVALGSPIYYTFLNSVQWLGLKAIEIPSVPGEGMSLEVLGYAMSQTRISACIVIANFNNPLGSLMPDKKKKELVKMTAGSGIPLIEDDVYGGLAFGQTHPSSLKAYDETGMVLYCSSFSKTLTPGYRIGWIVPGRFRQKVEQLKTLFNIATASPTQLAIAEFLMNGGYDHHLRKVRRIYARQTSQMRDAVIGNFPAGTKVSRPEGIDSLRLYERALKEGIGIAPGMLFTLSGRYRNCVRLNSAFWSEDIEHAIETLGGLAETLSRAGQGVCP